jgi:dTDP-4-dehydrorhamnose reductase
VRALITGADGQLARELVSTASDGIELRSVGRAECDITDSEIIDKVFESFRPDIVINTAAYTAVDAAEENKEIAFEVNARGAENVAKAAELLGARLIHISSDYVFDGHRSTPYPPEAQTNPINVYGASKVEGEKLALAAAPSAVIVRVGWLYSTRGKNFLSTILTALRSSRPLSVVTDQEGCPTSAHEFAIVLWQMSGARLRGIYHWSNSGSASWYDFAREIARVGQKLGLLGEEPEIRRVTTAEYPRRAQRPAYSVLDSTKLARALEVSPSTWQQSLLRDMTEGFGGISHNS